MNFEQLIVAIGLLLMSAAFAVGFFREGNYIRSAIGVVGAIAMLFIILGGL